VFGLFSVGGPLPAFEAGGEGLTEMLGERGRELGGGGLLPSGSGAVGEKWGELVGNGL
jgi:hypothetical protein